MNKLAVAEHFISGSDNETEDADDDPYENALPIRDKSLKNRYESLKAASCQGASPWPLSFLSILVTNQLQT